MRLLERLAEGERRQEVSLRLHAHCAIFVLCSPFKELRKAYESLIEKSKNESYLEFLKTAVQENRIEFAAQMLRLVGDLSALNTLHRRKFWKHARRWFPSLLHIVAQSEGAFLISGTTTNCARPPHEEELC